MAFSNAKPRLPDLFKLIIESDNERKELIQQPVVSFEDYKALLFDRRSLSQDAEKALRRSPDHGARAR